jgi:hypothetical protein
MTSEITNNFQYEISKVQWAPLNGITDNRINIQTDKFQITYYTLWMLNSLIIIISQLMELVCLCPKVIPISGFLCINVWLKINIKEGRLIWDTCVQGRNDSDVDIFNVHIKITLSASRNKTQNSRSKIEAAKCILS